MPRSVKATHLLFWLGGIVALNWPGSNLTMGVFHGYDNSLLIASMYGALTNAFLFYGTIVLVSKWFRANMKLFLVKLSILFISTTFVEIVLDYGYYFTFHQNFPRWILLDVLVGNLLLNALFFLAPGLVYGIITDWSSVEFTDAQPKITIKDGGKKIFLDSLDIYYIKSDGNYAIYHTARGKIMVRESLSSLEDELPHIFKRSHRSFIVNTTLIQSKTYDTLSVKDQKIPIGRTYANSFK